MGKKFFRKKDYEFGSYIDMRDYYCEPMVSEPEFCNEHPELASNKAQRALVRQWKRYGSKAEK